LNFFLLYFYFFFFYFFFNKRKDLAVTRLEKKEHSRKDP
jgi:hypothetical protein